MYNAVTDASMIEETASVPTTNVAPERDFAVLDRMIREKPNAHLVALESMILYSHNKSSLWLQQKTQEEKDSLLKAARTLAPIFREKFKKRRQELERQRQDSLVKKKEDLARKEHKLLQEKEKLTKEIEIVGLWRNKKDISDGLCHLKSRSDKVRVLKSQINFRRKPVTSRQVHFQVFPQQKASFY